MNILKPLSLRVDISTANTVNIGKLVYVFNDNAATQLVTIANTTANTSSITLGSKQAIIIQKTPTDTILGTGCWATNIGFTN